MNETSQNRIKIIFTVVIVITVLGFSAWILLSGSKESTITIDETTNTVTIEGMYSQEIIIDSDPVINLISPLTITRRTNGSSGGNSNKEYFTLEEDLAVCQYLSDADID